MQGSALCHVPYGLLRIGLLLSLLQHCHNASLPPDRRAAALAKLSVPESSEDVVYSSSSISGDRAEKQRGGQSTKADHLPTTDGTNQKELAISRPPVYTIGEKPGEKLPQLITQVPSSQPTYVTSTTSAPLVVQPPMDVLLQFINMSAVLISWSYPDEDQSNPVHFLVRYSHDGDPYINAAAQPTRERSYVYSGMLYGGYYQFQVVAIQSRTTSQPVTTDYFINGITAPPGPPINVRARALSPSEIDLEWDGPLSPTPLLYLIQWGDNSTRLDKRKEVYQSTHVTFGDLDPGHTYYFQLRADISGRISILTEKLSATTYQIDLPPVHILVEECVIHTTWIAVKWSKPSATHFPLSVNSFTVYYRERKMENPTSVEEEMAGSGNNSALPECGGDDLGSDVFPHSDSVPGDAYTVNVTQLDPGATYVFCVRYSSGKFMSDWSASQELSTLYDINCSLCAPQSSTEILLNWSIKSSSQADLSHPLLLVYEITHTRTLVANFSSNTSELALATEGEMLVDGLHPWTNYTFEVDYLSPVGQGAVRSKCPTTHCHTLEGIPLAPPANMAVLSIEATSITLTWEPPPVDTLNGRLIGYTFKYRCYPRVTCPTQSCPELLHRVPVLEHTSIRKISYKFEDLMPFMNYTFEVAAETLTGCGPFSFTVTMETKQTAPSSTPENVTLIDITEISLSLRWEEPPGCSWNGIIIGYVVRIATVAPSHQRLHFSDFVDTLTTNSVVKSTGGQLGAQTLQREASVPGTRADIGDLQPRTLYSITIAAATSEGIGPFSMPLTASTLDSVMNRLVNMSLSVNIAERMTEECLSVSVSWQQLSSQEAGLFLPSSINNAMVYGNWEYLIHFVSLTPGIDDRGNFSVDHNDSFYALPVDVLVQGAQYMLWITADVLLLNGTTLHIRSLNVTTQIPTCSVGPYNPRTWTVAAVVLVVLLLLLLVICLLSVCFYRWLKKSSVPSPMLINMESYTSDALDSEEGSGVVGLATADRRRGDGWSGSSSSGLSEESIKSGSSVVTNDESADADSQEMMVGPGESGVGVVSLPALAGTLLWPGDNEGYVRLSDSTSANERPLHDLPLAPRQQPDGCSISSSSSQSSLLHCDD